MYHSYKIPVSVNLFLLLQESNPIIPIIINTIAIYTKIDDELSICP